MPLMWSPQYAVNVPELDAQHKRLFEMMNELHEAMLAGREGFAVGVALAALTDYTRTHFVDEEAYMRETGYPDYEAHVAEHRELLDKVEAMRRKHEQGRDPALSLELVMFLYDWLSQHIQQTDRKYAPPTA